MRIALHIVTLLVISSYATGVLAEDHATQVLLATVKIQHDASTATGFLIVPKSGVNAAARESLLVTANHVFDPIPGEVAPIILRLPQPDGTYQRRDLPVAIRANGKPLWTRHPQHDVAVVKVTLPPDDEAQPLPFDSLADEATLKQQRVRIGRRFLAFGYPARVEANPAGFPLARHASLASYPVTPIPPHPLLMLDMSAHGGDSGGPVMLETADSHREEAGTPILVGLVVGKVQQDERIQTLYEERTVHHPLDLSIAVQAHFIRETIGLWEKSVAPATNGN
ncbi:MAG: serine protease [Planctomycetota bacterium]|nr:serine protease [Planctomycetota bacterium]